MWKVSYSDDYFCDKQTSLAKLGFLWNGVWNYSNERDISVFNIGNNRSFLKWVRLTMLLHWCLPFVCWMLLCDPKANTSGLSYLSCNVLFGFSLIKEWRTWKYIKFKIHIDNISFLLYLLLCVLSCSQEYKEWVWR